MNASRLLALLTIALCMTAEGRAGEWPQWRGVRRDGVWQQQGLPERLPASLTARWRKQIGGGYGGVAVVANRVYLMDRQKEPREVERVLCLDAANGNTLWEHSYPVAYGKLDYGNGPRTTPTIHAGKVYAYGAVGHLHCLDAMTGKPIWAIDTVKELKGRYPTWGHSASPLLDGDRLIVQVGANAGCLMAFDPATGKELWRSLNDRPGYASPFIAQAKDWRQVIHWSAEHITGLDPASGKALWQVPFEINYDVAIADVVWHDGILLASNYWTGSKAFTLDAQGRNPRIVWEGKQLSMLMSSPLTRAGRLFAIDRFRGLKCLELRTGKVLWEGEFVVRRGDSNPHATLVWAGERALIFNEDGDLILGELSPAGLKQQGKASVARGKGRVWAHPAFAAGCIFARTDEEIVCVPLTGDGR